MYDEGVGGFLFSLVCLMIVMEELVYVFCFTMV